MTSHVIQLRVGSTSSEIISPEEEKFFKWFSSCLGGAPENRISVQTQRTIPITNEEIHVDGGRNAYIFIQKALDQIDNLTSDDMLIIDVEVRKISQLRMHLLIHVLSGVEAKLRTLDSTVPSKVVFILDNLIPETDQAYRYVQNLMNICNVVVIDKNGECNDSSFSFQTDFIKKRILSKNHSRHSVARKMVRHLGHFRKMRGDEPRCVRHFYDGKYCEKEIADYLYVELVDQINNSSALCYESKLSPWLVNSILSLKSRLDCKIIDLSQEEIDDSVDRYILILDFIDSGQTLVDRLENVIKDPERIISIVATDENPNSNGKRFIDRQGKHRLEIEYLVKAEIEMLPKDSCYLCDLGIPFDQLESLSLTGPMRSIDFWQMAAEAGLVNEENPPDYRDKIETCIGTYGILTKNGGFIATRIAQIFAKLNLYMDVSLICPDNEKASSVFSMYLELLLSKDVICVPRTVIDRFSKGSKELEQDDYSAEWYAKLATPSVKRCVVIDDLSVTGSTIVGICSLLNKLDKKIEAIIPLVDVTEKPYNIATNIISLYEWHGEAAYE